MTFDEWKDKNMPDWRDHPCNGWNDPNEGWYNRYVREFPNTVDFKPRLPELPEDIQELQKQLDTLVNAIKYKKIESLMLKIPEKVLDAEQVITNWFAEMGIETWQLGNIQSRR